MTDQEREKAISLNVAQCQIVRCIEARRKPTDRELESWRRIMRDTECALRGIPNPEKEIVA